MSLSQHDRRVLADIEQHLAEDDPHLTRMLSSFGKATARCTLLPRLLRRCRAVPVVTAAFLSLAVTLLVVAIAIRSAALVIAATAVACVSALPKLTGSSQRSRHGGRTDR
jgi:Flp pilus assembly protein TadB